MIKNLSKSKMRIPVSEPFIGNLEAEYSLDAIKSGWVSGSKGSYIDKFEKEFSKYCDVKYGVACSSGTTALHLAIASLDLKADDEVIVPTFTNIATILCVIYSGAKPILVDSDPDIWGMDAEKIQQLITKKTKAIIPVHIYGHPVNMDKIMKLAEENNLIVIEDAAEAHGAEYKNKKVGGIGHIGCFSFYANKIITTGEGGMLVTDNKSYAEKSKMLANLAFSDVTRYQHKYLGFNYRLSNILAAFGCAQLEQIEKFVDKKRTMGKQYTSLFSNIEGIQTPVEKQWAKNVYWMYGIVLDESFGMTRDQLRDFLAERGIETRTFFVPMHMQQAFHDKGLFREESHPISEKLSENGLYLPSGLTITNEQISYVVDTIKEAQETVKK